MKPTWLRAADRDHAKLAGLPRTRLLSLLSTLRYITSHPLNTGHPVKAVSRFVRWQIESRLKDEVEVEWIEGSRLVVKRGMTGATGNVYCGLHEFVDMAFLLHLLRPDDLFVDIGANVGSYTVLASKVCGARTICVEPDPVTAAALRRNILANGIEDRVIVEETALGASEGTVNFTVGLDTINRVAAREETNVREVRLARLDAVLGSEQPALIKMDVEGFEAEVLRGAADTLAKTGLLGIITEDTGAGVVDTLTAHGFTRWYYDPVERKLSQNGPVQPSNNGIFLRANPEVADRLRDARKFAVMGKEI